MARSTKLLKQKQESYSVQKQKRLYQRGPKKGKEYTQKKFINQYGQITTDQKALGYYKITSVPKVEKLPDARYKTRIYGTIQIENYVRRKDWLNPETGELYRKDTVAPTFEHKRSELINEVFDKYDALNYVKKSREGMVESWTRTPGGKSQYGRSNVTLKEVRFETYHAER